MASECGFTALLEIYIRVDNIDVYGAGAALRLSATRALLVGNEDMKKYNAKALKEKMAANTRAKEEGGEKPLRVGEGTARRGSRAEKLFFKGRELL